MTNQPPSDLLLPAEVIRSWATRYKEAGYAPEAVLEYVAWEAAQWGADKELDACCEWHNVGGLPSLPKLLRAYRRPFLKPPTLKQQALEVINSTSPYLDDTAINTIRRALEQLND